MKLFGPQHLVFLAFSALIIGFAIFARRRTWEQGKARWLVAGYLVAAEIAWTAYCTYALDVPFIDNIPIHLCDIGLIVLLWHLLAPSPLSRDLLPYLGIPGAALALLLPHITEPEEVRIFSILRFFVAHTAIVAGGLRATVNRGYVPSWRATMKAFVFFALVTVPVGIVNAWLGKNYCYSFEPPQTATFLHGIPTGVYRVAYYAGVLFLFVVTKLGLQRALMTSPRK